MDNIQEINPHKKDLLPFDPIVIVRDVVRKWLLILIIAVVCGVAAYIIEDISFTPVYQSTATLVVTNKSSTSTVYDNISSTTELAGVFTEVLNSSLLRSKILEQINMSHFSGTIAASPVGSTNLLTLRVTSTDPRSAFLVIQTVIENHQIITYDVLGDIAVEVLQHPAVPGSPSNSAQSFERMQLAAVGSALLACVAFAFLSYQRDTVRSLSEAERKLDCWCLGEIHHERRHKTLAEYLKRRKKSILITNPETGFRYVSTIGKLRRRIEQHMHKHDKVLMVTSVLENEGKSTVAANLALAMAKKHGRVLLLDLDLHKPACHKILEISRTEHCANDVISGTAALEDAVIKDRRSNLYVLVAKKTTNQKVIELFGTDGLKKLIKDAREQFDFVVVDLAPMSMTTDAEIITDLADSSILIVRQNEVGASAINKAIATLENGQAKLLGCVLNNVYSTRLTSGEGYDTGYGRYGSYGKYGHYGAYASRKNS